MPTTAKHYDYIIVGAGSAGCVLARRLSEENGVRLLVLEAGGSDNDLMLKIPAALSPPSPPISSIMDSPHP